MYCISIPPLPPAGGEVAAVIGRGSKGVRPAAHFLLTLRRRLHPATNRSGFPLRARGAASAFFTWPLQEMKKF